MRVFKANDRIEKIEAIGINYNYLSDIKAVFKSCNEYGVKLSFNGTQSLTATHTQLPNFAYLVMACRL